MIVFVGSEEKGFFVQDIAKKRKTSVLFIKSSFDIEKQIEDILAISDCRYVVYDIEQYTNAPKTIAEMIHRIQLANSATPIIYASGYNEKSDLIRFLRFYGISNYIFSITLSEKKEDLENCLDGKSNTVKEIPLELAETEKEEIKIQAKTIGIAGAITRMGTTTQAIQFVKYLLFKGYKACYIEMNDHGWVKELQDCYEDTTSNKELGCVTYRDVDLYYQVEKLQEVLKQGYDYYVYDYGVFSDRNFNKISFLEKDLQVLVVGTKPGEFRRTYELIDNNFYNNVSYIFNFILDDKEEQDDIRELMGDKKDKVFFSSECRDAFRYTGSKIYEEILPVESVSAELPHKKRIFSWKMKKKLRSGTHEE